MRFFFHFLLFFAFSCPVFAKETYLYSVYTSGFHVMDASLDIDVRDDAYDILVNAKTHGILNKIAPWSGSFETNGVISKNGDFLPNVHKSTSDWRKDFDVREYVYKPSGNLEKLTFFEGGKSETPKLNSDLAHDTTDILSASLVAMVSVSSGGGCATKSDIFDGKRRFALIFNDNGTQILNASKHNIYSGDAASCTVEVVPKGGRWRKKPRGLMSVQEQGKDNKTQPTVWIASVGDGNTAVPVKFILKTKHGTFFVHLNKVQSTNVALK